MLGRKIAAGLLAVLLGLGTAACGSDDRGGTDVEGGPGQSTEEDPTLGDPEGGGTNDDGADEGDPANQNTDSGSGTGAGRGDG